MPVESVAAYINNTFTFILFILVCILLFLIAILISTGIRKRVLKRNRDVPYRETDGEVGGKGFNGMDPFKTRNTAMLGMIFILTLLSVILILAAYGFSLNMAIGIGVFIISLIVLVIIIVVAYMLRSGVLKR